MSAFVSLWSSSRSRGSRSFRRAFISSWWREFKSWTNGSSRGKTSWPKDAIDEPKSFPKSAPRSSGPSEQSVRKRFSTFISNLIFFNKSIFFIFFTCENYGWRVWGLRCHLLRRVRRSCLIRQLSKGTCTIVASVSTSEFTSNIQYFSLMEIFNSFIVL